MIEGEKTTPNGRRVTITAAVPAGDWDRSWTVDVAGGPRLRYLAYDRSRMGEPEDPLEVERLLLEDIDRTVLGLSEDERKPGVEHEVPITL
jgi:hypothetical protein